MVVTQLLEPWKSLSAVIACGSEVMVLLIHKYTRRYSASVSRFLCVTIRSNYKPTISIPSQWNVVSFLLKIENYKFLEFSVVWNRKNEFVLHAFLKTEFIKAFIIFRNIFLFYVCFSYWFYLYFFNKGRNPCIRNAALKRRNGFWSTFSDPFDVVLMLLLLKILSWNMSDMFELVNETFGFVSLLSDGIQYFL